ncbi:FAD-binding oxidoreductase [Nonomuraea sediminis]|uniref:FAD-binding oxidoreductase n=1 Tax=Nonomuraea sediminis TaxID=2835864 RepID=UPI001BDBF04B|nr:FAD-dependent oxidoreductase [Nonomuraea sediminis]
MTQHIVERTGTLLPGEPGYDEARQALHAGLDPHPALIVPARSAADVRSAVLAARERGVRLAVQATGHGTHVPADGCVLLKTTEMDQVEIDLLRGVAKVGPGARWGQVIDAARPYGLAPLAGSSRDVGVTGYTLGGGLGWLGRLHGFAADSVVSAEIVTADGDLVTASRDSHPELFWALRGGGGNFGVVTRLEFRLYPVSRVWAGIVEFPASRKADLLERYLDYAWSAPDHVSTALMLTPESAAVKVMAAGDPSSLAPLGVLDGLKEMAFAGAAMGGTPARHLALFDQLGDLDVWLAAGEQARVEIRHWGGALSATGPDAGPIGHRSTTFSAIVDTALPGLPKGGAFLNFLADTTRTPEAYSAADYARLAEVKRAYDPAHLFSVGHTIR